MKRLITLFAMIAFVATSGFAENSGGTVYLEPIMSSKDNIVAKNDGRFSTGHGDHIYMSDKANGKIVRYNKNGVRSDYADVEGIWTAITSDDAGNILINKGFAGVSTSTNWVIIEPNGTTHELMLYYPDGVTAARVDAAGRIIGNVMSSEGGYFCLMPNQNTSAAVFHIANGAQVGCAVIETEITADASTIAQPTRSDILLYAFHPTENWAFRRRSDKHITRSVQRSSSDGFDIFQLGGNTYTVEPIGTNYYDGFAIFMDGESEPVAVKEETITTSNGQRFQSLTARVSADGSYATIYQNVSGEFVAMYKFSLNEPPAVVEAPTFTPDAGEYENSVTVSISAVDGADIRYTLDESDPTIESALYKEPITLNSEGQFTIKAIAIKEGVVSDVVSSTYTVIIAPSLYDFEYNGLFYKINQPDGSTATLVRQSSEPTENYEYINGEATIPEKAIHDDVEYSVTAIGSSAFVGCDGLSSVIIPNTVVSIGDNSFAGCQDLVSVVISNSVTTIGDYAFKDCKNLLTVTNNALTPQRINETTFSGVDVSYCTLLVPEESFDFYNHVTYWKDFFVKINGVEDVEVDAPTKEVEGYYDLKGIRLEETIRGQVNIVRYKDGSSQKTAIKE